MSIHAQGAGGGSDRGAVVLCGPVSERAALLAGTQFETAFPSGDELILHLPTVGEGIVAAMEVARWSRVLPRGDGPARIVVVEARGSEPVLEGLDRARQLLSQARPGRACMESAAVAQRPTWVATDRAGDDLAELRWAGSDPGDAGPEPLAPSEAPTERTPMVGRRQELLEIADCWHDVCGGGVGIVLIAGEPGSGKTRLAAEACGEIAAAGGIVLYGAGDEAEPGPYAPFVAALADSNRPPHGPAPSFRDVLTSPALAGRPVGAGLGVERSTLFSHAVRELEHRCRAAPVTLVIEDLHQCGPSSLQLLKHLARSPDLSRLLIVGTYRPTDLEPDSEQATLITDLRRGSAAGHLELEPLDRRALRGLAASFGLGRASLVEAGDLAAEETAGLPLYACELLRSLDSDTEIVAPELSRSLQVLIATRVRKLGEEVHADLGAAAVAGLSFDPEVVAEAAGIPPERLAESLRRAERAGVVLFDQASGEYCFGHALTRRCLYEEIGGARRGQLHQRLALAMSRRFEAGHRVEPGRIAQHWQLARPGEEARAAEWAKRAAERALAGFDPAAAVRWYERALELDGQSDNGAAGGRCDLLLGLGTALRLEGDARFREILLQAARLAIELDDTERLASAVLTNDRGFVSAIGEFDRERLAMLELARERVTDEHMRSLVLAQLALELTFAPERERRHELAEEALRLARATEDPQLLARVLNRCLIARWEPGNARERIKLGSQSVEVSARLDNPLDLFHALHWRAAAEIEACETGAAHRSISEEARIAARLGDPTADWLTSCSQSMRYALQGRLEEAESEAERAAALGQQSGQPDALPFYASQIASIRWQQGRLDELAPLLDSALERHPGLPGFRSLVALARLAAGNADGAQEAISVDSADRFEGLPRDPTWFAGVTTYAHVAAELDDTEAAAGLLELLEPLLGRLATTSVSLWGLTDHAAGRLAATLGDHDRAVMLLDRSMHEYARFAAPVWRGQAALDLALILARAGRDPIRESSLLLEAGAIGERYRAGLLSRVPAPSPEVGEIRTGTEERLGALDLTDRQRDIIALIARGMTNAEIAEELTISPRTVKRHLENAFARTGVRGRRGLLAMLSE